ncbi:MAG: glycosyltransferase, partial [Acidobacteria bacterium]|nr:glycosyltransferase [Acidobacteriota bacterium]
MRAQSGSTRHTIHSRDREHSLMSLIVSIVIPVYRSEQSLTPLVERILEVFRDRSEQPEIVLVDDVSPDKSWDVLLSLKSAHPAELKIARLLRNSGQHNAILCGFSLVTGDIVVTMDDDLQNPPEEIPKLIDAVE